MNKTKRSIIEKLTALVADLLEAAQEHPTDARRYTRTRVKVEQALKQIGSGYRSELKRPASVGLPAHELKIEDKLAYVQSTSDLLADNLPEEDDDKPSPIRKRKKSEK